MRTTIGWNSDDGTLVAYPVITKEECLLVLDNENGQHIRTFSAKDTAELRDIINAFRSYVNLE